MLAKYNRYYTPAFSDDFFNDLVGRRYYGKGYGSVPAVNIVEENEGFRIDVAAAGLSKKDFNINIENDVLTISAERKEEKKESKKNYTRREFNYGSFSRSFQLNEDIDQESIKAQHENGVLSIHLPKKEESVKPGPRAIEIG